MSQCSIGRGWGSTTVHAVCSSWPSVRPAGDQGQAFEPGTDLTYEQLQHWLEGLIVDDSGQLVISSDSLHLLPNKLPYELLGPLILAAVDRHLTQAANKQQSQDMQRKHALQNKIWDASTTDSLHEQQRQMQRIQQQGLRLVGIDLQQPVAGSLTTCMAAYHCLQHLSLQELNIDVFAAQALGSILSSSSSGGCGLRRITLNGVFMCDLAWQALCKGLAAGCELQSMRLHSCLGATSLAALARAVPAGCLQLSELDLSNNSLVQHTTSISSAQWSSSTSADADAAWGMFLEGLLNCKQLHSLTAQRCSLGPKAAAAVEQLLKAKNCRLMQLDLAHCSSLGAAVMNQLVAAAACCGTLEQLNFSNTSLTEIKPFCQAPGWISRGSNAGLLQQLNLGGNMITAHTVDQLAKAIAYGGSISGLSNLSLAGCHAVGDEGAIALAMVLTGVSHQLTHLDLSSCELTDTAVEALKMLLAPAPSPLSAVASTPQSPLRSPFKWKVAATEQTGAGLKVLKLVDNQITSKGMQILARAIRNPLCTLQLLDVSWNWVGPQGMEPLVKAAAAANCAARSSIDLKAAAAAGCYLQLEEQQPRCIKVLRECLPEYWRVEAAKAATGPHASLGQDADIATTALAPDGRSFAAAGGFLTSSTCSGSCCSIAGSVGYEILQEVKDSNTTVGAPNTTEVVGAPAAVVDKQQLWVFNTLCCTDGGSSQQSSGIAAGIDACSDICNLYADSNVALSHVGSKCSSPTASSCSNAICSGYNSSTLGAADKHAWLLTPIDSMSSMVRHAQGAKAPEEARTRCTTPLVVPTAAGVVETAAEVAVGDESSTASIADALSGATHLAGTSPDQKLCVKAPTSANIASIIAVAAPCSNTGAAEAAMRVSHTCHITRGCVAAVTPSQATKKLVPMPPPTPNTNGGSCASACSVLTSVGRPSAPLAAQGGPSTSGLKMLRSMRCRVTEAGAGASFKSAEAVKTAAAIAASGPANSKLPFQKTQAPSGGLQVSGTLCVDETHDNSSSANKGAVSSMGKLHKQQIKAVASSGPAAAVAGGLSRVGRERVSPASLQHGDPDSYALKDCTPVMWRTAALPSVAN